jgi:cell division protein FtsA
VAKSVNLPAERDILHSICQRFTVDEQTGIVKPEGMEGVRLSVDVLILHGVRSVLRNMARPVQALRMDVQDIAFSGLCSALAVLTPEQKTSGALVIDLGGGTTDYVAYAGGVLAAAGAFGVGGDHVTNDVALCFGIPQAQAERLKKEAGSAIVEAGDAGRRVSLPPEVGFPGRSVSIRSLHAVIGARMEETLEMIRGPLEKAGLLHQMAGGIVLSGGGAHLRNVCQLAEKVFGLPCAVGRPRGVSGLATATEGPECAACLGMVQYGFRTQVSRRGGARGLGGMFRGLFGR